MVRRKKKEPSEGDKELPGLSDGEREALQKICDLLVPASIDIKLKDVFNGYSKERATGLIMKEGEGNPATTSLKMMEVHKILKECYK